MNNIEITVCDPANEKECESQVYSNYKGMLLGDLIDAFESCGPVPPEIGNFPHVAGHHKPVKILSVYPTSSEDNAGVDVHEIFGSCLGQTQLNLPLE